jgi:hypothetical protein
MKNILTLILLAAVAALNAQVILGDAAGTAADKSSVLLEFSANQNKGIIVPYVRALPTAAALVGGAIILDATSPTAARMKYYNGTAWIDLSGQDADVTSALGNQPTILQAPENPASKAIIGARTSSADGVLVLESNTKAMVLPQVGKVSDIPSPSPGMIVYVNGVFPDFNKRLAVFNGSKWSYWKP